MKIHCLFFLLLLGISLNIAAQVNAVAGKVLSHGETLQGVVVTDGHHCVLTDNSGYYQLPIAEDSRFVYISSPSGYLVDTQNGIPRFYKEIDRAEKQSYNFELYPDSKDETNHVFIAQADVQLTSKEELGTYRSVLKDCRELLDNYSGCDVFGLDCGDIVGDTPALYPDYIKASATLNIPIYRAIGNHDMNYYGRSFETSYKTFEHYFGPTYYSFNKGQAHYIVINNNFYIGRDYFYMGYVDEKILSWLEEDLSYVPKGTLVFLAMHIPSRLQDKQESFQYNYSMIADQTVNAEALHALLKPYVAHIISGHMHYNLNLNYSDSLMEHNTAAVCGTWWRAEVCLDGTPRGYGVYEITGNKVKWYYKSAGFPKGDQFRAYMPGSSDEYPNDIIVNVWNWDKQWKVEWLEDGKLMGEMIHYTGFDPYAKKLCADKKKMVYDWISPVPTTHLFHATPQKANARIEIRVTDRFGHVYNEMLTR
ncbi:calcineurin-like phosphoesterase family protein [uncultured Bacteroides sp.]|uniref:calcineurin-like phosphoesterase family protein n=1 Tax=uncultured Bacteroides sp. TaxID=162156 RepID=UPI002AA76258|nr:calcineurin-like phosphoesterase family protein [uncultured Bacteroides sp.]